MTNDVIKQLVIKHLANNNVQTKQSSGDADTLIVSTVLGIASSLSSSATVSVIAEDYGHFDYAGLSSD